MRSATNRRPPGILGPASAPQPGHATPGASIKRSRNRGGFVNESTDPGSHGARPGIVRARASRQPVGPFADHRDIGHPAHPGSATDDARPRLIRWSAAARTCGPGRTTSTLRGSQCPATSLCRSISTSSASMPAPSAGGYLHRKGGIVLRQDLDPDLAYVDAVRMSNQQLSLQYRETKGGPTRSSGSTPPASRPSGSRRSRDYAHLFVPGPDGWSCARRRLVQGEDHRRLFPRPRRLRA